MLVAEIGQNHCGDMKLAKRLIRDAKQYGADLAKFQLFDSQKYYGHPVKAELTKKQAFDLFEYGKQQGIEVFFSVFDIERVDWCEEMGVKRYKLATFGKSRLLIEVLARLNKPVIISLRPLHWFWYSTCKELIPRPNRQILYCDGDYPSKNNDLFHHISFKRWVRDWESSNFRFWYDGYSDHTIGLDACKIAISRGAKIIEKHFSIGHGVGPDGAWSMVDHELYELRRFYDTVQKAL